MDEQEVAINSHLKVSSLVKMSRRIPYIGIVLTLCSSFFLGTAGMLVKLTKSCSGIQVCVFRATFQLVSYGLVVAWRRLPLRIRTDEMLPVLIHASLGGLSIIISYYVLNLIPLSDATTIRFSLPIWTLGISFFALNESCGLYKLGAVAISVTGVMLIAKPDVFMNLTRIIPHSLYTEAIESTQVTPRTNSTVVLNPFAIDHWLQVLSSLHLQGCLLAIASSFTLAISLVANRMCSHMPTEVIIVWLSLMTIVVGSVTLLFLQQWRWPDNMNDILLIALNGFCGTIGQWFMTNALKVEQPSIVALTRTFDLEVAFVYSAFLLHERIVVTSIMGSIFVISGVLLSGVPRFTGTQREAASYELDA